MYITDAFVCGSRARNTSDKSYLLFTREAGMIWASGRSVREERSKNRYALQDFSLVRASLVHGKGGWKVTSVESSGNFYFDAVDRGSRILSRNILRLLRRFVQGEDPHPKLFDDIVTSFKDCVSIPEVLEVVLTLRILNELGYIAPKKEYEKILEQQNAYEAAGHATENEIVACEKSIKYALEISHL